MLKLTSATNISRSFIPQIIADYSLKCNTFDLKRGTVKTSDKL